MFKQIQEPSKPYPPSKTIKITETKTVDTYESIEIPEGAKSFQVSINYLHSGYSYEREVDNLDVEFYFGEKENPNYNKELSDYELKLELYKINLSLYNEYVAEKERQKELMIRKTDELEFERLKTKLGK